MTYQRVTLKVCEGCGTLWFRKLAVAGVYCVPCTEILQHFPDPKTRLRPGRPKKQTEPGTLFTNEPATPRIRQGGRSPGSNAIGGMISVSGMIGGMRFGLDRTSHPGPQRGLRPTSRTALRFDFHAGQTREPESAMSPAPASGSLGMHPGGAR